MVGKTTAVDERSAVSFSIPTGRYRGNQFSGPNPGPILRFVILIPTHGALNVA